MSLQPETGRQAQGVGSDQAAGEKVVKKIVKAVRRVVKAAVAAAHFVAKHAKMIAQVGMVAAATGRSAGTAAEEGGTTQLFRTIGSAEVRDIAESGVYRNPEVRLVKAPDRSSPDTEGVPA